MVEASEKSSHRPVDEHVGGKRVSARRTWKDEVGAGVVDGVNDIWRLWLPPVLLARWDTVE